MRILKSISSALLAIVFSISIAYNADAATVYLKTALTGGTSTCLDYVDGDSLAGNDAAFVLVGDYFYVYLLSASSGAVESSPGVISPDSNAGTKRWILKGKIGYSGGESLIGENLNVTGTIDATGITDTYMPYMQAAGAGFGDSPLSTDGTDVTNSGSLTVQGGTVTVGVSATTAGNLVLNHAGAITFYDSGNDTSFTIGPVGNGTTTIGMTGSIDLSGSLDAGTLTIGSGSITDSSGAISFGNENLSTTGTLGSGDFTISDATPSIVLNDSADTDWWISGLSDLQIGTGSTPGSSEKVTINTAGNIDASGFSIDGVAVGTSTDTYWSESGGDITYAAGAVIASSSLKTPAITAPAATLAIKPTTDATTAVQVQDKDGTVIGNFDTVNNRFGVGTNAPTTTFAVAGGQSGKKTNVSDAAYGTSALTTDYIVAWTALTAAITATISTEDVESGTATQPRVMKFKDQSGNADDFPITIVLENSGTIDGQAAYSINQAYGAVEIWLDGSNGHVAP